MAPRLLCGRNHRDALALALAVELDDALDQREQRVIAPDADVRAGIEPRAALAHDDVTGNHALAAEALHAQALGIGVAAVAGGTGALFRGKKLKVELEHSRAIVPEGREIATRSRASNRLARYQSNRGDARPGADGGARRPRAL